MSLYGPGRFERRTRIGLAVLGFALTFGFLLVGLFDDPKIVLPHGELVTATVQSVVPDSQGHPRYVQVSAVTSHGATICSLSKVTFPKGVLPESGAQFTAEWAPEYCGFWKGPVELPGWYFFLVAGVAGTLTAGWLLRRRG
ncbi:hypothetical protein [Actinoplanes sp. HUAS TT8]|uniref:hypothetical protein n=1 Tax=Actinoplanes sp. HUAS TT8 TaxID=3447453 RepID=UPI003F52405F